MTSHVTAVFRFIDGFLIISKHVSPERLFSANRHCIYIYINSVLRPFQDYFSSYEKSHYIHLYSDNVFIDDRSSIDLPTRSQSHI